MLSLLFDTRDLAVLTRHVRTVHTGVKSFICEACNFASFFVITTKCPLQKSPIAAKNLLSVICVMTTPGPATRN